MHEHIFSVLPLDKAIALGCVEPLHCAFFFHLRIFLLYSLQNLHSTECVPPQTRRGGADDSRSPLSLEYEAENKSQMPYHYTTGVFAYRLQDRDYLRVLPIPIPLSRPRPPFFPTRKKRQRRPRRLRSRTARYGPPRSLLAPLRTSRRHRTARRHCTQRPRRLAPPVRAARRPPRRTHHRTRRTTSSRRPCLRRPPARAPTLPGGTCPARRKGPWPGTWPRPARTHRGARPRRFPAGAGRAQHRLARRRPRRNPLRHRALPHANRAEVRRHRRRSPRVCHPLPPPPRPHQ